MPSTYFPDGRVDVPRCDPAPTVLRRSQRGRVQQEAREERWEVSATAAQRLAAYLPFPADGSASEVKIAAGEALARVRGACAYAGRSPIGCDVWALPHGRRRIGLVFGSQDAPGVRTVVLVLGPDKMDDAYPSGQPAPDWQEELARGEAALAALGRLAAADPRGDAARALAEIRAASGEGALRAIAAEHARLGGLLLEAEARRPPRAARS